MNKKVFLFLLPFLAVQFATAQSTLIPAFKSPQNQYDYLIVTPKKFLTGAQNLAQFRQSFSGYKAGVVLLDTLYAQFDSVGRKPCEKIWHGLKYAYKSWSVPPKMVVLMGADSLLFNASDTTWSSRGDLPVAVYGYGNHSLPNSSIQFDAEYSDDFYAALNDSTPSDFQFFPDDSTYAVAIGRIPCDSVAQCERYVQKIIDFETNKHLHKSWFNSAIVASDDTMQESFPDPLGYEHLMTAEECANTLLRSWFVSKVVGCAYAPNSSYFKPQSEDSIINATNRGAIWSIYVGHGNSNLWSDEHMLLSEDVTRLHNDSMPSVFVAFTGSNGDFVQQYDNSMCKQFLFSSYGGALAYISGTTLTFAEANKDLMRAFFSTFNGNPQMPLGRVLAKAKTIAASQNSLVYCFLGDPALTLSDGLMHLSMSRNDQNQVSFSCQSSAGGASSGNFDVRFYKRDTVRVGGGAYLFDSLISRQTGTFANGNFTAAISESNIRVVAYVWNSQAEGRVDSSFILSASPTLAQVHKNPISPALTMASGKLIFHAGALHGSTIKFTAFTVNGKTVVNKEIALGAAEITIDPKSMGLAAGAYFFRLSTIKGTFSQRMILDR
jgi:hypothetical protein